MTWTHPCCDRCWEKRNVDRQPVRLLIEYSKWERCCHCGEATRSGIYVREDPKEVPYPAIDEVH